MKYAWINDHDSEYPVTVMCRILQVSVSGYYGCLNREPSAQRQRRENIAQAVKKYHIESNDIYGYRKVWQDLAEAGIVCCDETVRRIMVELGLRSRVKRKFVVTTDSNHQEPIADNILDRDFDAVAPDRKWVADITYIATLEGWLYLAAVMDLYSRRIVGWSMSDTIDAALVKSALDMAIFQRRPDAGLIHHSDRGVQYA